MTPMTTGDLDPAEERAVRWKRAVERRVAMESLPVSGGHQLTDAQIMGVREGVSRKWRVPPRSVFVSHHGIPVLAPDVDLVSLPRELRERPELYLDPTDRAQRDDETWPDYAERVSTLLLLAGRWMNKEGAILFLAPRRVLNPMDDLVWDRFVAGDPETVMALQEPLMSEKLPREMYAAAVAASRVDAEDFVGPLVRSWVSSISTDLAAATSLLSSTPVRLLEALDEGAGEMRQALEAKDPGKVVAAETRLRGVCAEVAREHPELVGAYLSLVVPFSKGADAEEADVDEEVAAAYRFMTQHFEERFAGARGDVRTLVGVCSEAVQEVRSRIDGNFDGEGPRYPKLPLNLIREFASELDAQQYHRKERRTGVRPRGVSLPWK